MIGVGRVEVENPTNKTIETGTRFDTMILEILDLFKVEDVIRCDVYNFGMCL